MYEILNPRPTEPDAAVVKNPDSVTQFVCIASQYGKTHHISGKGKCTYCKETRSALAKRYGIL